MTVRQRLTAEQLWEMPEAPGKRFELLDGEPVEVAGTGALHGLIVELILRVVGAFAREHRLGPVFGDGVSYVLSRDPDRSRIPDVSFVSRDRLPDGRVPAGPFPLAPDLAIEVVSPGDRASDLYAKVREYLAAGTKLVWVCWPEHRTVSVYAAEGVRELGPDDELDGGDVLPGFHALVADLFDVEFQ